MARLIIVDVKGDIVWYQREGGTGDISKADRQRIIKFYERDYSGEQNEGIL